MRVRLNLSQISSLSPFPLHLFFLVNVSEVKQRSGRFLLRVLFLFLILEHLEEPLVPGVQVSLAVLLLHGGLGTQLLWREKITYFDAFSYLLTSPSPCCRPCLGDRRGPSPTNTGLWLADTEKYWLLIGQWSPWPRPPWRWGTRRMSCSCCREPGPLCPCNHLINCCGFVSLAWILR